MAAYHCYKYRYNTFPFVVRENNWLNNYAEYSVFKKTLQNITESVKKDGASSYAQYFRPPYLASAPFD